jgi:cytochrome b561
MESAHYNKVARILHWTMALLLVGNLIGGLIHDIAPRMIMPGHFMGGLLILTLAVIRLLWRFTHRPPAWPAHFATWEKVSAGAVHWALYAMMILVPLSGWVMVSSSDRTISIYGLFTLPKLPVEQSEAFGDLMSERHELLAYATIALIVLHIAAALRHHYVKKDGMLARMWA